MCLYWEKSRGKRWTPEYHKCQSQHPPYPNSLTYFSRQLTHRCSSCTYCTVYIHTVYWRHCSVHCSHNFWQYQFPYRLSSSMASCLPAPIVSPVLSWYYTHTLPAVCTILVESCTILVESTCTWGACSTNNCLIMGSSLSNQELSNNFRECVI